MTPKVNTKEFAEKIITITFNECNMKPPTHDICVGDVKTALSQIPINHAYILIRYACGCGYNELNSIEGSKMSYANARRSVIIAIKEFREKYAEVVCVKNNPAHPLYPVYLNDKYYEHTLDLNRTFTQSIRIYANRNNKKYPETLKDLIFLLNEITDPYEDVINSNYTKHIGPVLWNRNITKLYKIGLLSPTEYKRLYVNEEED